MYNLELANIFWLVAGAIVLVVVLGDFDWKRKLLRRHGEKNL